MAIAIVVHVDGAGRPPEEFVAHAKKRNAAQVRLGVGAAEICGGWIGGPGAGKYTVVARAESMQQFEEFQAKAAADPEWQALEAEFRAAGWSYESFSIAQNITP